MKISASCLGLLFLGVALGSSATAAPVYHKVEIGPGNLDLNEPPVTNNAGQVALTYDSGAAYPAQLITPTYGPNGVLLGKSVVTLGFLHPDDSETLVTGLNNAGQVVGYSAGPLGNLAFRTAPNQPINPATDNLGTLGGPYAAAQGINDLGQAVGYAARADGTSRAFRTGPNQAINPVTDDLGTLPGFISSEAKGINNAGQVVGVAYTSAISRAFLYDATGMHDLGTGRSDNGGSSTAIAINQQGLMLCEGDTDAGYSSFLVDVDTDGTIHKRLLPMAGAKSLNDNGDVLFSYGWVYTAAGELYKISDHMAPGDSLDPNWYYFGGINNAGQVTTVGAYVLVPVPEPAGVALMLPLIPVLLARRNHRPARV